MRPRSLLRPRVTPPEVLGASPLLEPIPCSGACRCVRFRPRRGRRSRPQRSAFRFCRIHLQPEFDRQEVQRCRIQPSLAAACPPESTLAAPFLVSFLLAREGNWCEVPQPERETARLWSALCASLPPAALGCPVQNCLRWGGVASPFWALEDSIRRPRSALSLRISNRGVSGRLQENR